MARGLVAVVVLAVLALVAAAQVEAATRSPTKKPTTKPSAHPSTSMPSVQPTTSFPTPSPTNFDNFYSKCCEVKNRQPPACLALTKDQCDAMLGRRLLNDIVGLNEEGEEVERDAHGRSLAKPGTTPCFYYFTTLSQLRNYVYGTLRLKGATALAKVKSLYIGQGSKFCIFNGPESDGDCGCHAMGGWCGFKNRQNCMNYKERVIAGGPNGETMPIQMCTWDLNANKCVALHQKR